MQYQKVLKMLQSIPYLSVGLDASLKTSIIPDDEVITPQEHCERYLATHPDKAQGAA